MPSPFPGMDPYLENADVFGGFHDQFIVHLAESLQAVLPPPYYAKGRQRIWVERTDGGRLPDVSVVRSAVWTSSKLETDSAVATLPVTMPVQITVDQIPWTEFHETYLEVYTKQDDERRLVTAIELLSPSNKASGEKAHGEYRRKQDEVLSAEVNLIEIDLLRGGPHTTAVPRRELQSRCGPCDYHVCLHRFDKPKDYFIYPIQLTERLPTIAIPLLPNIPPVEVPLQSVFERCYDAGPYRLEINYALDPPPPALLPERLAWVRSLLAAKKGS
jgi:hypothetical protein